MKVQDEFGIKHQLVEHDWMKVLFNENGLENKISTRFYYKGTENQIPGQKLFRKVYNDKNGQYIMWHKQKIYFQL